MATQLITDISPVQQVDRAHFRPSGEKVLISNVRGHMRILFALLALFLATATSASGSFELAEKLRQSGKFSEALPYYETSARENNPEGIFWLATFYYEGLGTNKNISRARELFVQAAEKKVDGAFVVLANIYSLGQGVPIDLVEAHKWISLAWGGDISKSPGWQKSLESKMKPEQISEAKRRVYIWLKNHP